MRLFGNIYLSIVLVISAVIFQKPPGISAQSELLFQVSVNGRNGYINDKGKLLFTLPDQVYQTGRFSEGLALFSINTTDGLGRVGYIDVTGKVIIQPQFVRAEGFSEGLAPVRIDGYAGYIDRQGRIAIKPEFFPSLYNMRFSEGLAAVEALVDTKAGRVHRTGYINKQGEFVIQPQFGGAFPFKEGMALIKNGAKEKYGYIDKSGRIVVPVQFHNAFDFSEGLAMVTVEMDEEKRINKLGFIDKSGNFVVKPIFDDIFIIEGLRDGLLYDITSSEGFSEGMAAVKVNGLWGFIDRSGQIVIRPQFVDAGMFREGLAPVAVQGPRKRAYGFIDRSGRFVIQPQYDGAREFNKGLAQIIVLNSQGEFQKAGYINKTGDFVWKPSQ